MAKCADCGAEIAQGAHCRRCAERRIARARRNLERQAKVGKHSAWIGLVWVVAAFAWARHAHSTGALAMGISAVGWLLMTGGLLAWGVAGALLRLHRSDD